MRRQNSLEEFEERVWQRVRECVGTGRAVMLRDRQHGKHGEHGGVVTVIGPGRQDRDDAKYTLEELREYRSRLRAK